MDSLIDLQMIVCPDLLTTMQKRFRLLHTIQLLQPIGRRSLADQINMKERVVRNHIDFLTQQGLLSVSQKGVYLTNHGDEILTALVPYIEKMNRFDVLEEKVKQILNLDEVIITPGDSDQDDWVKFNLGSRAFEFLKAQLRPNQTIAVTGGTTMATVAEMIQPSTEGTDCLFVPARGGLGEQVENQANTICAQFAHKTNGKYRLLYVPDPLSEDTYQSIIQEPGVKEVLEMIQQSDIVMHGIGDACTMAERRKTTRNVLDNLIEGKAVSEAFGYYFDREGKIVDKVRTVGMQLEDLKNVKKVIAVAGGKSKAEAIDSYFKQGKSNVLITDEGAAKMLIKGSSL